MKETQKEVQICCVLENIKFNKTGETNTIADFYDYENKKYFTGLGSIVDPTIGVSYKLKGSWKNNETYGPQFHFSSAATVVPLTVEEIENFIVKKCKGIGPNIGKAICDRFGVDALTVLREDPLLVSNEISGLSLKQATEIQEKFMEDTALEDAFVRLEGMLNVPGMRKNLAKRIIDDHKGQAPEMVAEDPYILTKHYRVSFDLSDKVATKLGFPRTSIFRKEAAAFHCISMNQSKGHVWMNGEDLLQEMHNLIQIRDLEAGIEGLIKKGIIKEMDGWFARAGLAEKEEKIAQFLISLSF